MKFDILTFVTQFFMPYRTLPINFFMGLILAGHLRDRQQ